MVEEGYIIIMSCEATSLVLSPWRHPPLLSGRQNRTCLLTQALFRPCSGLLTLSSVKRNHFSRSETKTEPAQENVYKFGSIALRLCTRNIIIPMLGI